MNMDSLNKDIILKFLKKPFLNPQVVLYCLHFSFIFKNMFLLIFKERKVVC